MVQSRKNERIVLQIREKVALNTKMGGCYFECGKLNFLSRVSGVKSFAILPLIVNDEAIGFMGFTNYDPTKKIQIGDIAKFQRFVDSVALFFHNSRLYDELEKWNTTLENRVDEKTSQLQEAHDTIWNYKENLKAIIENTASGIIATDPAGVITVLNRAAAQIFRGGLQEIPGHHVRALFREGDYAEVATSLAQSEGEQHIARNLEREMVAIDGSAVPVKLSISRLNSRNDEPLGFIYTIHDLREVRFLESQLLHGEKLRLMGQMAAGISHEINTPLGMIRASAAHLRQILPEAGDAVVKHLGFIEDAVERGTQFIREMLEFSKPSPTRFHKIQVREFIEKAVEKYRLKIHDSEIRLGCEIVEATPPIYGDLQKLNQVVFNLIENACNASAASGEVLVRVSLGTAGPDDIANEDDLDPVAKSKLAAPCQVGARLVRISVIDQGSGIPPGILGRIFDPFFSTKGSAGTGLGLAIALSLVKRHHGAMEVRSKVGEGTTMTLKLPLMDDIIEFERMI